MNTNEFLETDLALRRGELKEYKHICPNCFTAFHPNNLTTSYCPNCRTKIDVGPVEVSREPPKHSVCLRCGYTWKPHKHNPTACPSCNSKQWFKSKPAGFSIIGGKKHFYNIVPGKGIVYI